MNLVILLGRLVNPVEAKRIGTNSVCINNTIAVNRTYNNQDGTKPVDFIPIVVWNKLATFMANYVSKGAEICIEGELRMDSYPDKDNPNLKRYKTYVVVSSLHKYSNPKGSSVPPENNFNTNTQGGFDGANVDPQMQVSQDDLPF